MSTAAIAIEDHVQGDGRDYDFTVVDAQGNAENISSWLFWFTGKLNRSDSDAAAAFQLKSADGEIVIDVAADGLGRIKFASVDTKNVEPAIYFVDFQCRKGSGGKIETLATGTFTITPEITLAE